MSRKNSLDARKGQNDLSKRAEFPLEDDQNKLRAPNAENEEQPSTELEELPPPDKESWGPSQTVRPKIPGQSSESPNVPGYTKHAPGEHTGMTPAEIQQKRREIGEKEDSALTSNKPTWRDIVKDKLKHLDPQQKVKDKLEERYGPSEELQKAAQALNEFATDMANVDLESAKNFVAGLDLPDIIKERADRILRGMRYDPGSPRADEAGEIPVGSQRIFQHALNQLGARNPKDVADATTWLQENPQGQQFLTKARDQFLIRNVVNMLENTVLRQEGEGVIQTSPRPLRKSPQQKTEEKRIKTLEQQLAEGKITQEEFDQKLKGEEKKKAPQQKRESPVDPAISALNELQRKYNAGEISEEDYKRDRARLLQASRLNLHKQADTTGPGGEDWFSGYESGDTFPAMTPQNRRKRFPFHNKPKIDPAAAGPSSHGLPVPDGDGPTGDDSWGLLASQNTIRKTADNDLFECYTYGALTTGPWFSYTVFKKGYQEFKSGDVVVQYGKTPQDSHTYRRRFGNIKNAMRNINAAILPAIAVVTATEKSAEKSVLPKSVRLPGKSTPDESLHNLPDSKDNPAGGVYGPYTGEYDKQPWQGNRDGFDRAKPRREQDTKRNVFPYEDQEMSNQVKIFGDKLNLRKQSDVGPKPSKAQLIADFTKMYNTTPDDPELMTELQRAISDTDTSYNMYDENGNLLMREFLTDENGNELVGKDLIKQFLVNDREGRAYVKLMESYHIPIDYYDAQKYNDDEDFLDVLNSAGHTLSWGTSNLPDKEDMWMEEFDGPYTGKVPSPPHYTVSDIGYDETWQQADPRYPQERLPFNEEEFDLPGNIPPGIANRLNLRKQSDVGGYAAPIVETPEERAGTIEQPVVKPVNWDPKRLQVKKPKRYDLNESQLYNQTEYADTPLTQYTKSKLNLHKRAFDFNVSIFNPQTNQFVEETVLTAPSMEAAQLQAQDYVDKSYPGYSFQVTDPYNETPKTLGIHSVRDTTFSKGRLNLKKHALALTDPQYTNQLTNLFLDNINTINPVKLMPEDVDKISQTVLAEFGSLHPEISSFDLAVIAQAADDLLNSKNVPSNLAYVVTKGALF